MNARYLYHYEMNKSTPDLPVELYEIATFTANVILLCQVSLLIVQKKSNYIISAIVLLYISLLLFLYCLML